MINQETIQRIMEASRIEEVVGEFVSLRKHGANYIGCCPFHTEKTPSFNVSPSRGIFKCFGCGKAGNSAGFLMEHEHYSYPEALRYLAKKYNIEIEEERMTDEQRERQTERDGLFHVSEFAQKYFADLLYNDEMGRAVGLSYFHNRGLSDEVIKNFGLGYCLDEWSNFTDHALANSYSDAVLEKTGLTIYKDDGKKYDRFRGRVMFPIYSISGRVLGFSGRILSKEKSPAKYVNSPESEIYTKSNILYGLYQARNAISRSGKCYLVEGNIDVISMHQSGLENTVASCGTSLTIEQIRLIKRYTTNVTVLYDGDSAGVKAALRAVNLLNEEGMHVRLALFPDNDDPDSYAQKYGSTKLQEFLTLNEVNFIDYRLGLRTEEEKTDPIKKTQLMHDMLSTIALIPDVLERQEYVNLMASRLGVQEQVLTHEMAKVIERNRHEAWKAESRRQAREASQATPQQPVASQSANPTPSAESDLLPDGSAVPPPLEPLPSEYEDPSNFISDSYRTPRQELPERRNAESQERHIVELLVNFHSNTISYDVIDENDQPCKVECTVAEFIVAQLEEDAEFCGFDNPVFEQIYSLYQQAVNQGQPMPDANFFAMNPDATLRDTALEMLLTRYSVSDLWLSKKQILVPTVESHLLQDVNESVLVFKQKKVEKLIDKNSVEMNSTNDPDEQMMLLQERNNLIKLRKTVCDALNRVFV